MRARHDNKCIEFVLLAQSIYEQLKPHITTPDLNNYWSNSISHIVKTRSHGDNANKDERWIADSSGNRHGTANTIPGMLGEFIAIAAIHHHDPTSTIDMSTTKRDQVTNGLDFVDTTTDISYQVKTIRISGGVTTVRKGLGGDRIALVDIDDNKIFVISTATYEDIISAHPDTRLFGSDGVVKGWHCATEVLQEINLLPFSDTRMLYHKPSFSLSDISKISWNQVE